MELGYFAMPLHPPEADLGQTIQHDMDQIVLLDQLGYTEAWIGEHFTSAWENIPAPELFIAEALGRTEQIKLGTGVTCLPNHNPFHIAHRIAQLDHQARGRFRWGIGSGATPLDFDVFGVDDEGGEHRPLTLETLEMVLKIWAGLPPGTYENKFWRFTIPEPMEELGFWVHLKPYQQPHPPIAVAGLTQGSETLKLAGERGWIPMSINYVPSWVLKTHWEAVAEGAARGGRAVSRADWRIAREVFVAPTSEEARAEALQGTLARDFLGYFRPILAKYRFLEIVKHDPAMADEEVTAEYMVDNRYLVGSPEEVAGRIRKLYDEVGGFGVLLAMAHEWEPREKWERSMRLLAEEVMPMVADLAPEPLAAPS